MLFSFVITKTHNNDFEVSSVNISIRSFTIMFHHMWFIISVTMIFYSFYNLTTSFSNTSIITSWFWAIYIVYLVALMFKTGLSFIEKHELRTSESNFKYPMVLVEVYWHIVTMILINWNLYLLDMVTLYGEFHYFYQNHVHLLLQTS